jgi:hypothetical protein
MTLRKQFGMSAGIITMSLGALYFAACDSEEAIEEMAEGDTGEEEFRQIINGGKDVFELDGNKSDQSPDPGAGAPTTTGIDWDNLFAGAVTGFEFAPLEDTDPDESVFSGGGSKDINDIPSWRNKTGSTPPKDDILKAYAAAYTVGPDQIIYFGAERFSNNGDALLGFWFFQEEVADINGNFSGEHTPGPGPVIGDLLILANFSNGGSTATIQVLEWVGTGGNQQGGTLNLLFTSANALCNPNTTDQTACAITNSSQITEADGNVIPPFQFFEGGINITKLFGAATPPCFASFLAETRSSTSVTATLKDFVGGAFEPCASDIEITAACDAEVGVTLQPGAGGVSFVVPFVGTVCNKATGGGGLDLTGVAVEGPPNSTLTVHDSAQNNGIDVLVPDECQSYDGTFVTTDIGGETDPGAVTFEGTFTVTANNGSVEDTAVMECPLCPD